MTTGDSTNNWITIAPLLYYADRNAVLRKPVEFAGGISLGPVPPFAVTKEIAEKLFYSPSQRLQEAMFAFSASYPAKSLGDRHPDSTDDLPLSWQRYASTAIVYANIALWITKPTSIGYEVLMHFERRSDPPLLRELQKLQPILHDEEEEKGQLTQEDLDAAISLHAALLGLQRKANVSVSIKYLYKALTETMWESRFIFYWVVAEALFGPADGREMTYRLSHRIARFIGGDADERRRIFKEVKDAYGWRSKVVHGARLTKLSPEDSAALDRQVSAAIRRSYLKILPDEAMTKCFDGKDREQYLDNLSLE